MIGLDPRAREVLDLWFGAPGSPEHGRTRKLWFAGDAATDLLIRSRYAELIEAALRGERDAWAQDAHGALALILVLDQFTRNAYRGTPRAFAGDERALALAAAVVERGDDRRLSLRERWFAYLPFEHAESAPMQEHSVALFRELSRDGLAEPLAWALRHRDVIARFGRFPHRNEILGRTTTDEEAAFLAQPGSRF